MAGRRSWPKPCSDLTGLKINHFLYVDLAGFQGVIDDARRRRHVHHGREREHPGLRRVRDGRRDDQPGLLQGAGAHRRPANRPGRQARVPAACRRPGAGLRPDPPPQVRLGGAGLLPDPAAAAVPARGHQSSAAARAAGAAALDDQADPVEPAPGRRAQARRPRLPHGPAARDLHRGDRIPHRPRLPGSVRTSGSCGWIQSAERIFAAIRQGKALGTVGEDTVYTPPSEATVRSWWSITRPAAR